MHQGILIYVDDGSNYCLEKSMNRNDCRIMNVPTNGRAAKALYAKCLSEWINSHSHRTSPIKI